MKLFKRMAAAIAAIVMIVTFAGCHPANETAITVGDVTVSSGMYMCFLIQADSEARDKVDEANADNSDYDSSTVNYNQQTVEDTDFTTWVKNRAKEAAVEYATYIKLFNDKGLTLSDDDQSEIETYTSYYWDSYGYSQLYGENGVSLDTYKQYVSYNYISKEYFLSIYGEDGTNPVDSDTVKTAISDNFAVADELILSYNSTDSTTGETTQATDDEIAAIQQQAKDYESRIKAGESFGTIYTEVNGSSSDGTDTTDTSNTADDAYETIFVSEAAQDYASSNYYSYDYWDDVKSLAVGDTAVINDTDKAQTVLLYKYQDILDNDDYITTFTTPALYILKQDEFEADIKKASEGLDVQVNDYAVNRFKPSKIVYPQTSSTV